MCLLINVETTKKLIRENPDKLTVYKYLYETKYGELHSIFYPYLWKPGENFAFNYGELSAHKSTKAIQYTGFHVYITKEEALKDAILFGDKVGDTTKTKLVEFEADINDLIWAGVWEGRSTSAVFSKLNLIGEVYVSLDK